MPVLAVVLLVLTWGRDLSAAVVAWGALIVTLMADGGDKSSPLARDTVFAAVMITCNGVVGVCLLVASLRHGTAVFNAEGTGAALATVTTLATLSLVLPTFTTSKPGPGFSSVQLTFAALSSLILYGRGDCAPPAATVGRPASTSRSAPPWPASA